MSHLELAVVEKNIDPSLKIFGAIFGVLVAMTCLAAGFKRFEMRRESRRLLARQSKKEPGAVAPEDKFVEQPSPTPPPRCPKCRHPMKLRRAKNGPDAGKEFWGCSRYPKCQGNLDVIVPRQFGN